MNNNYVELIRETEESLNNTNQIRIKKYLTELLYDIFLEFSYERSQEELANPIYKIDIISGQKTMLYLGGYVVDNSKFNPLNEHNNDIKEIREFFETLKLTKPGWTIEEVNIPESTSDVLTMGWFGRLKKKTVTVPAEHYFKITRNK